MVLSATSGARRWMSLRAVLTASFWIAFLGLAVNVPCSLLLVLARGQPAHALLDDYTNGVSCILYGTNATRLDATRCEHAAAAVAAFTLPGALYVVSELQVLQYASAATYFVLKAIELPLQAAALSMPALMGDLASAPRASLAYGVPLVVLGLALWARAELRTASRRHTGGQWDTYTSALLGADAALAASGIDGIQGASIKGAPNAGCAFRFAASDAASGAASGANGADGTEEPVEPMAATLH